MIFDPDHMSAVARHEAMDLMEEWGYSGVVSSHSWADAHVYERILRLGGVVTPMAGSSPGFVRKWEDHRSWADDRYYYGIGFGSDINGFATQGAPRGAEAPDPVSYPFEGFGGALIDQQVSGERVYDVNIDGVAHYGLYPDWVEDLRQQAGDGIVADLERGVESYLQMWERALGVYPDSCRPDVEPLADADLEQLRAGMAPEQVVAALGQPRQRAGSSFRYCTGTGMVTLEFDQDARLIRAEDDDDAGVPPVGPPGDRDRGRSGDAPGRDRAAEAPGRDRAGGAPGSGPHDHHDHDHDDDQTRHVEGELVRSGSTPGGSGQGILLVVGLAGLAVHGLRSTLDRTGRARAS
jgi:hypothetical protein